MSVGKPFLWEYKYDDDKDDDDKDDDDDNITKLVIILKGGTTGARNPLKYRAPTMMTMMMTTTI